MDDAGGNAEYSQQLAADDGVHTFDIVVDRLADVVQHSCLTRERLRQTEFRRNHPAQMPGLLAVQQRVLSVRKAVMERADQFSEFRTPFDLHQPQRTLTDLDHLSLCATTGS